MSEATRLPDTALSREARAMVERIAPDEIMRHSIRAFLLGKAYANRHALAHDEEGLYLAALFHDVGLCKEMVQGDRPFTVTSSQTMRAFLEKHDVERDRIELLCDAIELHMQLRPRWSRGNEVGLLQVGAWMDVTGLRRWSVRAPARTIASAYPRGMFDLAFPGHLVRSIGSVAACTGLLFPPRAA